MDAGNHIAGDSSSDDNIHASANNATFNSDTPALPQDIITRNAEKRSTEAKLQELREFANKIGLPNFTISLDDTQSTTTTCNTSIKVDEKQVINPDTTFIKLPGEIRNIVYRLLLHSPILAEPASIDGSMLGEHTRYDLHPAILAVCTQVHLEARHVLYDEQTLYFACIKESYNDYYWSSSGTNISLLTRYHHRRTGYALQKSAPLSIPSMKFVTSWKIVVAVPADNIDYSHFRQLIELISV
jgi:hypothetical protein